MIYKMLPKLNPEDSQIFARIGHDGLCCLTCTAEYPEFQAWLAEGNEPSPPDEPTNDTETDSV
jgi:hypothetical protein